MPSRYLGPPELCRAPRLIKPPRTDGPGKGYYPRNESHLAHLAYMRSCVKRPTPAERFWAKVDKSGGPNACWPWTAHRLPAGYGTMGMGGHNTRHALAHRLAWIIENGWIPKGMLVLHYCDYPPCVNIRHLYLGTKVDNSRDAYLRGAPRKPHGRKKVA